MEQQASVSGKRKGMLGGTSELGGVMRERERGGGENTRGVDASCQSVALRLWCKDFDKAHVRVAAVLVVCEDGNLDEEGGGGAKLGRGEQGA